MNEHIPKKEESPAIQRDSIGDPAQHRVKINLFIEEVHNGFVIKEAEVPRGIILVAKDHTEVIRLVGNYVKDQMNEKLVKGAVTKPKGNVKEPRYAIDQVKTT